MNEVPSTVRACCCWFADAVGAGSGWCETLAAAGVVADRVDVRRADSRGEPYLATYHRIDLGLDTFPYNGHTTSLDAYYMGVPVVTLVGQTVVGRAGLSQMTNLGLTDLVAHDPDQYVRRATDLALDRPRMAELRRTLRDRMRASPLMDAPRFARGIESAYRQMWREWCAPKDNGPAGANLKVAL